jgi:environmental stress-induced protein Ves
MRWTRIQAAEIPAMPWKNGGGSTVELFVDPPGATLAEGFAWRLSTADVGSSGPFSAFPGIARTLLLLEGAGFWLDFGERGAVDLLEPLVPVRFQGDWPATATLVGGPCRDLNLMVDPARCAAELRVRHLDRPLRLELTTPVTLAFVARGTLAVPELGLHLGQRHALRVDGGEGTLQLVPGYGGASAVLVGLTPR